MLRTKQRKEEEHGLSELAVFLGQQAADDRMKWLLAADVAVSAAG